MKKSVTFDLFSISHQVPPKNGRQIICSSSIIIIQVFIIQI